MRLLVFNLAIAWACAMHARADTLYGDNFTHPGTAATIYQIDTNTGLTTPVVTVSNATQGEDADITFLNDVLYVTNNSVGGTSYFGTIDLNTGVFTAIAPDNGGWQGLAANPAAGILYAVDDSQTGDPLLSVTPSGTITAIGDTNIDVGDLAFNSNDGILYALDTNGNLYTIDTTTGAATNQGATGTGGADTALGYDNLNNVLYVDSASCKGLCSVNTSTGATTFIGGDGTRFEGLADLTVPEPGGAALSGLGLAALVFARLPRYGAKA
jgi:hypothetical protein